MKRVVLHSNSFNSFWAHYSFYRDAHFSKKFLELGYDLVYSNEVDINPTDYILFFEVKSLNNLSVFFRYLNRIEKLKIILRYFFNFYKKRNIRNRNIFYECKKNNSLNRTILIVLEGIIDAPENHSKVTLASCNYSFTWNDELVDNKNILKINWPQPVEWPVVNSVPFDKKKLLVNVSANKYSKNKIELYSERRKAISYFESKLGDQFDLYGFDWNKPVTFLQKRFKTKYLKFKSYKGTIKNKAELFPKYKFALVYENARIPGWITEKIFDCLRSNCIPIYLGAPNIVEYVPEDLFIDRTKFSNDQQLVDYLINFDEGVYNQYINRITNYLKSSDFNKHLSTSLVEKIVNTLENNPIVFN
jgi:hypothetical protein